MRGNVANEIPLGYCAHTIGRHIVQYVFWFCFLCLYLYYPNIPATVIGAIINGVTGKASPTPFSAAAGNFFFARKSAVRCLHGTKRQTQLATIACGESRTSNISS